MENQEKKLLENITAQMRKGILDMAILLTIAKKETYATEIITTLKSAQLTVVEGTIYPLLSRLKNMQLLDYLWQESESGPPRKYYKLTKKGTEFLHACEQEWKILESAIKNLKK